MTYRNLAFIYDELMKEAPYERWLHLIDEACRKYEARGKKFLDLGCGTGEILLRMAEKGYEATGVDISAEMLSMAMSKGEERGIYPVLIEQNMAELEMDESFHLAGIFCDSLNYLLSEEEVQSTFRNVYNCLEQGGLLIFDVHTVYKINEMFIGQTYTFDSEEICYIWNCFPGEFPNSVEHDLVFFVRDDSGKYDRFDEFHAQRTFPLEQYKIWLESAGFDLLEVIGDFGDSCLENAERLHFIARK